MILAEKTLTAKDRKNLDEEMFGLPSDRKYPLNDESHVRKAIQYFKFCKPTKRTELAKNINRRIRELNMKTSVSKDNPFSKFADKKYVTIKESVDKFYANENIEYIDKYAIYSYNDITTLENCCMILMDEYLESSMTKWNGFDNIKEINNILNERYEEFESFNESASNTYHLAEAASKDIINLMKNDNTLYDITPQLEMISMIPNKFHAYRLCCEMMSNIYENTNRTSDISIYVIENYLKRIDSLKSELSSYISNHSSDVVTESVVDLFSMNDEMKKTDAYNDMLQDVHIQSRNDLYIINAVMGKPYPKEITSTHNIYIDPAKFSKLFKDLTFELSPVDLLFAKHCKDIKNIETKENIMGDTIYFGNIKDDKNDYLITKCKSDNDTISLTLICCDEATERLLTYGDDEYTGNRVKIVRYTQNASITNQMLSNKVVSEAFAINEDGDIKITISPKNSYMDSYSSNHKLLVANWKNKNYEAMKKNLAYVFALITMIERSDEYKRREPMAVKARAFAINDFKTYLKLLQSVEPEFDFVEYYAASEYDKKIINIPKTTIIGIKKLMRTILI